MENIAIQVKPKRMSRKIILTDEHFATAVTSDQRRQLFMSDMALTAQRLITTQEDGKLVIGGVNELRGVIYVDLTTPDNQPVIRLTRHWDRFELECRTKQFIMSGKASNGSGHYYTSDSPSKFKYVSRLVKAARQAKTIEGRLRSMWSTLQQHTGLYKKTRVLVSLSPEVLLYLNDIRNNRDKVVDSIMEGKVNEHINEAKKAHEDTLNTLGNTRDFFHNPVWYVEPYPDVGVAVCQASYAGTTLTNPDDPVVQITKPMVYASSLDTLPDDYRIPVMVRLKMLKAHIENTKENLNNKIYDMIPIQDKFYDDVGVFTYSGGYHSYRYPCAVLFA
jgi:hypothetical protein